MLVNLFASSSCLLSLLLFLAQTIIILTLFGYSFQKVLVFAWLVIQHFQSFWHAVILSLGQQPQNPLLLLGQYSDDEADDGSSKGPNDKKVESPMLNEEVLYYLHISLKAKPRFFFIPYVFSNFLLGLDVVFKLIFLILILITSLIVCYGTKRLWLVPILSLTKY